MANINLIQTLQQKHEIRRRAAVAAEENARKQAALAAFKAAQEAAEKKAKDEANKIAKTEEVKAEGKSGAITENERTATQQLQVQAATKLIKEANAITGVSEVGGIARSDQVSTTQQLTREAPIGKETILPPPVKTQEETQKSEASSPLPPEETLTDADKELKQKLLDLLQPVMPSTDFGKLTFAQLKEMAGRYPNALAQYAGGAIANAAMQAMDIEKYAKEHGLTFEQALAELSQKLNIEPQELSRLLVTGDLIKWYMEKHSLGETDAMLALAKELGMNTTELTIMLKKGQGFIDDYAQRRHMTVEQAWAEMAKEFDLPVDRLQEMVEQYKKDPSAATWMTMPIEFREKLAGLAQKQYVPNVEYQKYLAENYIAVGTNLPPGVWQHQVIQEYADKHNMSWQEAHAWINKLRDKPDDKTIKDMAEADRDALYAVVHRLSLGRDYISKQDYERILSSDKELAGMLKKRGFAAYEASAESKTAGSINVWATKLNKVDPEGFKIYKDAGGGQAGIDAYDTFAKEREAIIKPYVTPAELYMQSGMYTKASVDTLKLVSDVNNKKVSLPDAVKYFGEDILKTIRQVNENYVQSATGEWYDKKSMRQLKEDDPALYDILMTKGPDAYDEALKQRKAQIGILEATHERDVQAAIIQAEADAAAEPVMNTNAAANAWQAVDNYYDALSALTAAMDKINKEHPGMSQAERGELYNALPEYEDYNKAKKAMAENRDLISDVMAEVLSTNILQPQKGGQIPTITFNREQMGKMYEADVKVTLATYTGDRAKLKKLYDAGAFFELYGEDEEAALKGYNDALDIVAQQDAVKKAVSTGNLGELERLQGLGAFGDDKESYQELYQYVKEGGRELAPITAQDIREVKASLGTKQDYIKKTAESYPSGYEMAREAAISMIPIVGTIRNWDKMGAGWKALSIITDIAIMLPFASAAARAARAAKGAETAIGLGGRLKATLAAMGKETWAQARAPVDIVIHPVQSAKGIGRGLRDIAGIFDPHRIGEFVSTLSNRVIIIRVPENATRAWAMRAVEDALKQAGASGARIIYEEGRIKLLIPRGRLMQELRGGLATAGPDIEETLKSGKVAFKEGLPAEEQGLFFATEPALEFTSGSAFGKGVIPIASRATDAVLDVSKYRIKSLVTIDKAPVRSFDFAHAKNVPEDLARAIQNYTRRNNGVLYGGLNAYTKLKKAPVPNDIDLVFRNQTKALDDIQRISERLGYQTRRVPHAIEIMRDGKWTQIVDVADVTKHKAMLPQGLSQKVLTRIDGIRTETMGEQYLRQSYGAVSKTPKAAIRADVVNKIAKEVRKRLKEAGAEKRVPGVFITSPEAALKKAVPTGKTWGGGVEVEAKYKVGESIVTPGAKLQRIHARIGPLSDRVDFFIEFNLKKPLSLRQIAKLKALELVEMVSAPFKEPIMISKRAGAVASSSGQLKEELNILESIIRQSGNVREADELRRIIRIETSARKAPHVLARAGVAGGLASQAGGLRPAAAKNIEDRINRAYEEEVRGHRNKADQLLRESEILRGEWSETDRVKMPPLRESLKRAEIRQLAYRNGSLSRAIIDRIIASEPVLRRAAERGKDVRVEAARLLIDARREIRKDIQTRTLRNIRTNVTPPRISRLDSPRSVRVPPPRIPRIPPPKFSIIPPPPPPRRPPPPPRTGTTPVGLRTTKGGKRKREDTQDKQPWTPEEIKSAVAFRMGALARTSKSLIIDDTLYYVTKRPNPLKYPVKTTREIPRGVADTGWRHFMGADQRRSNIDASWGGNSKEIAEGLQAILLTTKNPAVSKSAREDIEYFRNNARRGQLPAPSTELQIRESTKNNLKIKKIYSLQPVTIARKAPYTEDDTKVFVGETPLGMSISPTEVKAKKTLQLLHGEAPPLIQGRIGFQKYQISKPGRVPGSGNIAFQPGYRSQKKGQIYYTELGGSTVLSRSPIHRRRRRR